MAFPRHLTGIAGIFVVERFRPDMAREHLLLQPKHHGLLRLVPGFAGLLFGKATTLGPLPCFKATPLHIIRLSSLIYRATLFALIEWTF